jgi:uncharacterized protein (TIGR04255 family)
MHPFVGEVQEVPLARAPLVKVLCQVRFPRPLGFSQETIDAARTLLASSYPVLREKNETVVIFSEDGVSQQPEGKKLWTMSDVAEDWQVILSDKFVALETRRYTSRAEFIERLGELLKAVQNSYSPPVYDRIGVRYVNRIDDPSDLELLPKLVQPVALSGLTVPLGDETEIVHSITDTLFKDGGVNVQARWGWLPGGATIDAGTPAPPNEHWILDIDVYSAGTGPFVAEELAGQANDFAAKSYRLFRWVVTEDFIAHFGG